MYDNLDSFHSVEDRSSGIDFSLTVSAIFQERSEQKMKCEYYSVRRVFFSSRM